MTDLHSFAGLFIAFAILLLLAFPKHLLPELKQKKMRVRSTYWGFYDGMPTEAKADSKALEFEVNSRPIHTIVGSEAYASGKSTGG